LNRILITIVVIAIILSVGFFAWTHICKTDWCRIFPWQKTLLTNQAFVNDKLKLEFPLPGEVITSPLTVKGEARGTWYFEASFPVKILDASGNVLGVVPAQAKSDWMTNEFVPFEVTLSFITPATIMGTLVLEKDNPSGLPQFADSVSIPIRFSK